MHGARATTGLLVATALICAVAMSPLHAPAQAAERDESPDSAAVRSLWATVDAMWNARDAEQFADLFAVDGSFVFVDRGSSLASRAAIRQHFAERFPEFAPDLRHLTSVRDIRAIAPDVCTIDGKVEILRRGPGGSAQPTVVRTFAIFAVMLQTPEGWRIRVLRAYQLPTVAGTGISGTCMEAPVDRCERCADASAVES